MKSQKLLEEFNEFCQQNPDLRFWQALRNWSEHKYILAFDGYCADDLSSDSGEPVQDTFYWEGKNK